VISCSPWDLSSAEANLDLSSSVSPVPIIKSYISSDQVL
jgi:hypothetical protein